MKKSIVIIFSFVCIINNLLFVNIVDMYKDFNLANTIYNVNSIKISFKAENLYEETLESLLKDEDDLIIQKDNIYIGGYRGQAIYFKNNSIKIPLINGRFLIDDDFFSNSKKIVIGKNLKKLIVESDGKEYVKFNGIKYEVIGIMGYSNKDSIVDSCFYINFDGYLSENKNNMREEFYIGGYTTNFSKKIIESFKELEINNQNKVTLKDIIANNNYILIRFILIICALISSILIISYYYIDEQKKEVKIRSIYGADKKEIYRIYILQYTKLISFGTVDRFV